MKRRHCPSSILGCAAVVFALTWGSLALGDQIHEAVENGDLEKIKILLSKNHDLINSKDDNFGRTPLIMAVAFDKKDVVQFLLASKADVDGRDKDGWTALHHAADDGKGAIAELLLANKADVNARTVKGPTPSFVFDPGVDEDGHIVMKRRAANKADDNSATIAGWTPLHLAALEGKREMVVLLLDHKAEVNVQTANGWTPLHWAVSKGNKVIADLLRQHGGHQ
jgi:ankyrin repeat protein